MPSVSWLIERLEETKEGFTEEIHPLATYQLRAFKNVHDLFKEDEKSLAQRSKQRRSARLQARSLLINIFFGIGQELFLLCILAAPISTLASVKQTGVDLKQLREWWNSASHLQGLSGASRYICEEHRIKELLAPLRTDSINPAEASVQQLLPQPLLSQVVRPPQLQLASPNIGPSQEEVSIAGNAEQNANTPSRPESSILEFNFKDLLNFLGQRQSGEMLQMICPHQGVPLPYVEIDSGRIEFSYELSAAFIKFIVEPETTGR